MPGERVWARADHDPQGALELKAIEECFVAEVALWHVHVGGQVIRTTDEHPFWVLGKGWISAKALQAGDRLVGRNGSETAVEEVYETGVSERVYNYRVAEHHTYYIGSDAWGFDAWAHNVCFGTYGTLRPRKGFQKHHVNQDAAFGSVISRKAGLSIYLQGGTNVVGSVHYRFHQSLNTFWKPYLRNGALFGNNPLIRQYNVALENALRAAGKSKSEIADILREARRQQRSYDLFLNTEVPHVPGT